MIAICTQQLSKVTNDVLIKSKNTIQTEMNYKKC